MTRSIAAPAVVRAGARSSLRLPPRSGPGGLRVVMVVANDVTRDSRVLREAAVLAAAGHRVTVLGMMTANTTAPDVEVRDGFVIRRLAYRARPPGWWIPPDFYRRLSTRAERQFRRHRARLDERGRDLRRGGRTLGALTASLPDRAVNAGRRASVLMARLLSTARVPRWRVALPRRAATPVSEWYVAPPRRRPGTVLVMRLRALARRAMRTPLSQWPHKTWVLVNRSARHALAATRWSGRRSRRRRGGRRTARSSRGIVGSASELVRAAWRAILAWAEILRLLIWGTAYLAANGASRGALEWLTGWRWRWFGWARYVAEHAPEADVWHGHDLTSLPAVVALKRRHGGIAVYDSHEIYVESGRHAEQPRWAKAQLERLERHLVADVDAIVTVNRSLARILAERLGRPDVEILYNCPSRFRHVNRGSRLRREIGLSDGDPLIVYHGALSPHRGIDQLLAAIQLPSLRDAYLVFLGFGPMRERLRNEAADPRYGGRLHVLDAVRPEELLEWLVGTDVAVAPIQPSTLNHRFSSPNKVFEAIAVGTPVAGSDFPEFRRVIADPAFGPLGALFDPSSPEAIAGAVRSILDLEPAERAALTRRCRTAAKSRWNWETESEVLVAMYASFSTELLSQPLQQAAVPA